MASTSTKRSTSKKPYSQKQAALKHGWRSGLEEAVGKQLDSSRVPYRYEEVVLPYTYPAEAKRYTPDFVLDNGLIIETKGRWVTQDRKKMRLIKEQYPDLDIRFVFSNSRSKISKSSKTTYGMFCDKLGFPYADKFIPPEWLQEPNNEASLRVLKGLAK